MPPGELYTVEYLNTVDEPNPGSGYLYDWYGNAIDAYNAGQSLPGGDFDVLDVILASPEDWATVTLPAQFCWTPRGIAGDNYRLYIYSWDADDVAWTNYLGNVPCVTITGVPSNWTSGGYFDWWVRVYQGDDPANTPYNYGDGNDTRTAEIHFTAAGSSPAHEVQTTNKP
ncbi:MAG: hypothetical protein D6791_17340 [Chloroflexi bacterium]|nr:MAG: hypothetical protein D6791_17340 [Chloroflexota bacterium]